MVNDVFLIFDQMIVVDDVYVFSLLLMNDVYQNLMYYFPVMVNRMIQIQEMFDDVDENMMYHVKCFEDDYYAYNNESLLKTTSKLYLNKSSYDIKREKKIYINLYKYNFKNNKFFKMKTKSFTYENDRKKKI
jgi:hypothetical protein